MDGSHDFAASRLSFEVAGEGVAVDPVTGRLLIDTGRLGAGVAVVVTATNAAGDTVSRLRLTLAGEAVAAPTVVAAALADVAADMGDAPLAVAAAAAFAGEGLTFAVNGAGATIDSATGLVTIATDQLLDGERITVTATNSGGSAQASFAATVRATLPVCETKPALAGTSGGKAVVGSAVTLDPGTWVGAPSPELAVAWLLDGAVVAGATGASYTPAAVDEGKSLAARVTATNPAGAAEAEAAALAVVHAAPKVVAALADLGLFTGDAAAVVEAAAAFEGVALVFAVAGGGATVDAKGRVSVPSTAAGSATVTVTATNSGGSATVSFVATVSVKVLPPLLVLAPALAGTGRIGVPVTVSAGSWSGVPAPATSVQWLRDGTAIAGATATSYTPVAVDDGKGLSARVTAKNSGGSAETVTAALSVTYAPPVAKGGLHEEIFDLGSGVQTVAAAADFTGENLAFAVGGAGATIDAKTGLVSIPTDKAVQAAVTVTATNSGGSAKSSFQVTVEAEDVPFALEAEDVEIVTSVLRPEAQATWFTPVVRFPGLAGETVAAIEWTTSTMDSVPEAEYEVVTKVGTTGYQLYMRDAAKNAPTASPRVDYSVFRLEETGRREKLRFRWQRTAQGPWSSWSPTISVPPVVSPSSRAALPVSQRTKGAYQADLPGNKGQQYQRCRTWNLGIIDPQKRGWVISQQDENGIRLAKNANAGENGDPVLWGHPRLDGYHGGKSGGLYLNTDDNAGAGLFVGVTGKYYGAGFFDTKEAAGVYVGDGSLNWAKKVNLTRPDGPGPYVSGTSGPKRAFTEGGTPAGNPQYFGNYYDRQGNFAARRPQVPEMQSCTVFKTTKALLDADLAYTAGTKAVVYADATQTNRAVYAKSGASGAGSWSKTIEILTDAQRPIYILEQHGQNKYSLTYQALFKSTDGGASFAFVREFATATFADATGVMRGLYRIIVAPNGDVMIAGVKGAWLSTDGGVNFTQKYTREVNAVHFFGGSSTTVSGARIGDASDNSNGGVYATINVRDTAFAKPIGAGGTANAGLPANFNVWEMECAPSNPNRVLANSNINAAYLSTDGGKNWAAVSCTTYTGDEGFRWTFSGGAKSGHSGFLFCPTNEQKVIGWTFQCVGHSIDGGASFQAERAAFFDGQHARGTGTGPLTGTDPWKKNIMVCQDSVAETWVDGANYVQRSKYSTGDATFRAAITAAGGGGEVYAAGACGIITPDNKLVFGVNSNGPGQTNVMAIYYNRNAEGSYANYLIRTDLDGKRTRATYSRWSLLDPDGVAFLGRWVVTNLEAAPTSVTFTDRTHEIIDLTMDGASQISYWSDFATGGETGSNIYLSDHATGGNNQTTAWKATSGSYYCRAICIDPHTPERVLYVSNNNRSVIREIKRVNGSLADAPLKDASGNDVNLTTLVQADFNSYIPGGATVPTGFAYVSQLLCDYNMPGLFYAIVGVHGVPNLWMTSDNGLHWYNVSEGLPRTLWFGAVHRLTGDVLLDSSMGRFVVPPPVGYPSVPYKGALSTQLQSFYGQSVVPNPPVF